MDGLILILRALCFDGLFIEFHRCECGLGRRFLTFECCLNEFIFLIIKAGSRLNRRVLTLNSINDADHSLLKIIVGECSNSMSIMEDRINEDLSSPKSR